MQIREYLRKSRLVTDGAMGTYYAELKRSESLISEWANIEEPEFIYRIHQDYLKAGAVLIRTNTFAANRQVLGCDKKRQAEILHAACQTARKAINDYQAAGGGECFLAGDIGPIKGFFDTQPEDNLQEYKEMLDIFLEEGTDAILFETFPDLSCIKEAVEYAKEKCSQIFCMAEFSLNKNGYSAAGIPAGRLLEMASKIPGLDAAGFNCGVGSAHMLSILSKLSIPKNLYFCISPNAGYPEQMQNRMVFMKNAGYFRKNMEKAAEYGAAVLGACCGSAPNYIRELSQAVAGLPPVPPPETPDIRPDGRDNPAADSKADVRDNLIADSKTNDQSNPLMTLLQKGKRILAVELDPPYDAADKNMIQAADRLRDLGVDIITIADSPQGRSRMDSILTAVKIWNVTGMPVMPHICCRDKNMIAMRSTLLGAYANGIRNVLFVTGDPVPGEIRSSTTGVFDYNSIKLMSFAREMNREHFFEDPLYYGGAVNQGRINFEKEIERVQKKQEAGAAYFLTQPVYSEEDIDRLQLLKERTGAKILAGIMPFVSYRNACFVKNELVGIYVPEWVLEQYKEGMSREEGEEAGAKLALLMMQKMKDFADGYYFMLPFNRVSLMEKILKKQKEEKL